MATAQIIIERKRFAMLVNWRGPRATTKRQPPWKKKAQPYRCRGTGPIG
jgi:hypothetical protein